MQDPPRKQAGEAAVRGRESHNEKFTQTGVQNVLTGSKGADEPGSPSRTGERGLEGWKKWGMFWKKNSQVTAGNQGKNLGRD